MKYSCLILIQYSEDVFKQLFADVLKNIGFEPECYDVYWDEYTKPKNELFYNQKEASKLFDKRQKPTTVRFVSQLYDYDEQKNNENYLWLRIRTHIHDEPAPETIGDTVELLWHHNDLSFLLTNPLIEGLTRSENLAYCYFYNSNDVFEQSDTNYNEYSSSPLPEGVKLKKDHVGDLVIDTSQNWGRSERVRSIEFMAAPRMIFGPIFDRVINFKALSKSFPIEKGENDTIFINLFPIDSDPHHFRDIQKKFWDYLISHDILETYRRENNFDFVQLMKYRASRRSKKK